MNNKEGITWSFTDHVTGLILNDSLDFKTLTYQSKLMSMDDKKYISEVESLLKYF